MKFWKILHWLFGWHYVAIDCIDGYKVHRMHQNDRHGFHVIRKRADGSKYIDLISRDRRDYTVKVGSAMHPLTW